MGKCSGAGLCGGWGSGEAVREAGRAHVSPDHAGQSHPRAALLALAPALLHH